MDEVRKLLGELYEANDRLEKARTAVDEIEAELASARKARDEWQAQRRDLQERALTLASDQVNDHELVAWGCKLRNVLLRIPEVEKLVRLKTAQRSDALHDLHQAASAYGVVVHALEEACRKSFVPELAHG